MLSKGNASTKLLGRGIKKITSMFDGVKTIIMEYDTYCQFVDSGEDDDAYFGETDEADAARTKQG